MCVAAILWRKRAAGSGGTLHCYFQRVAGVLHPSDNQLDPILLHLGGNLLRPKNPREATSVSVFVTDNGYPQFHYRGSDDLRSSGSHDGAYVHIYDGLRRLIHKH